MGCDVCGLVKVPSGVEEPAVSIISECSEGEGSRIVLVYQTAHCHMLQDYDIMRRFVYNSVCVSCYLFCRLSYSNGFGHIWHLENLLIIMLHSNDIITTLLETQMKSYCLSEHYSINTFSMLYKPQAVL